MTYPKKLEEVILEIMRPGVPVSPTELVAHVNRGKYPAQFIHHMKLLGYSISTNKVGRSVVSYTLNSDIPVPLSILSSEDLPVLNETNTLIDPDWDTMP